MTDSEGLAYLGTLLEWRGSTDFDLDNISNVLKELGNPQDKVRTAHIAGTNGKGSVSCALSSILAASGYRVGLNISPHLISLNERVIIDGQAIDDDQLSSFALDVKRAAERAGVILTLHEGMTAIAFHAFRELGLDWAVMEVGLGGRLDSSNVIKRPEISAIVTIGFDHQHVLGNTLELIAAEKAGIIKKGAVVVTGSIEPGPLDVIRRVALEVGASCRSYGSDYWADDGGVFRTKDGLEFVFEPALEGPHQVHNMAVAIRCALELGVDIESCRKGVSDVYWPGRFETRHVNGRPIYFDCAHNEPGVEALLSVLSTSGISCIDIAFGALNTKSWTVMLDRLGEVASSWYIVEPKSPNAVPGEEIARYLSCFGVRPELFGADHGRFVETIILSGSKPLLITGSMYMIGAVLGQLQAGNITYWKRG